MAQWINRAVHLQLAYVLKIWDSYLPFLKIRPPSLDTCLTCHVFRNRSKYAKEKTVNGDDGNNDIKQRTLVCPMTNEKSLLSHPPHETEESRENIILLAAKHVKAAQDQKRLAQSKIELA
jgi:hypothetical protein